MKESSLHVFDRQICDDVGVQASAIASMNSKFAAALEMALGVTLRPERGLNGLLSESQLCLIEGTAGLLRIDARWIPDVRVYDRWIDCLPEIVGGLGYRFAEEWRDFSVATVDQLLLPRLRFADGVELVREWAVETRSYRRAIGTGSVQSGQHMDGKGLESLTLQLRRIADHFVPPPPPVVGTAYIAHKLGTTTQWVGQMIREGKIPKSCVLQSTGNGRQWKLHREKIDAWLDGR